MTKKSKKYITFKNNTVIIFLCTQLSFFCVHLKKRCLLPHTISYPLKILRMQNFKYFIIIFGDERLFIIWRRFDLGEVGTGEGWDWRRFRLEKVGAWAGWDWWRLELELVGTSEGWSLCRLELEKVDTRESLDWRILRLELGWKRKRLSLEKVW